VLVPADTSVLVVALFKKTTLESYLNLFSHMFILHFTDVASPDQLQLSTSNVTSPLLLLPGVLAAFDAGSTLPLLPLHLLVTHYPLHDL